MALGFLWHFIPLLLWFGFLRLRLIDLAGMLCNLGRKLLILSFRPFYAFRAFLLHDHDNPQTSQERVVYVRRPEALIPICSFRLTVKSGATV